MKDRGELEQFEKLMGQLRGLHDEISQLARKSANDGVNAFKLRLINKVLATANAVLGPSHRPFDDFDQFDADDGSFDQRRDDGSCPVSRGSRAISCELRQRALR